VVAADLARSLANLSYMGGVVVLLLVIIGGLFFMVLVCLCFLSHRSDAAALI
jgi:hypothetical protein